MLIAMPRNKVNKNRSSSKSALVSRNIWIGRRRTSIRLEPVFWDMMEQVCERESMTTHEICTLVSERVGEYGLTGAIRVFLISYAWANGLEPALATVPTGRLPRARGTEAEEEGS